MTKTLKSTSTNPRRKPAPIARDLVSAKDQSVTSSTIPPTSQLNSDLVSHSSSQYTAATKKKAKKSSAVKPKQPTITKDSTQEEGSVSGNQNFYPIEAMEEPIPDIDYELQNL